MNCQLDICGSVNTILTLLAAGFGWWLVHRFNSARDRINSERLTRTKDLSRVHSVLVRAGINGALVRKDENGNVVWENKAVEDAIGNIYLYGSTEQIALAQAYVDSWDKHQSADATALVDPIRNHIRASLGLESAPGPLKYLRITPKPKSGA